MCCVSAFAAISLLMKFLLLLAFQLLLALVLLLVVYVVDVPSNPGVCFPVVAGVPTVVGIPELSCCRFYCCLHPCCYWCSLSMYMYSCPWCSCCRCCTNTYISRVPQCLYPRPKWDPLALPQANVCLPSHQRRGANSPAGEGVGGPNSDDWRKSQVVCLLCALLLLSTLLLLPLKSLSYLLLLATLLLLALPLFLLSLAPCLLLFSLHALIKKHVTLSDWLIFMLWDHRTTEHRTDGRSNGR